MEISAVMSRPERAQATGCNLDLKPTLLWIDLTQQPGSSPLAQQLTRFCDVRRPAARGGSDSHAHAAAPDVLVFEYDYPDIDSLNLLRQARERHPGLPIVMFTLHHSEELAVWALRNRVWDYYYKPLHPRQLNDIGLSLQQWFRNRESPRATQQFLGNGFPDEVRFRNTPDTTFNMELAINYVAQHLGEKICEDSLAELYGISRFQFSRQFKKATDMTFQNYVLAQRIEKARAMLKNPSAQIGDIAFAVGFGDAAYFTRIFKRATGRAPSQCRA